MIDPSVVVAVSEALMTEFFSADDVARLQRAAGVLSGAGAGDGAGGALTRVDSLAEAPTLAAARVIITSWGAGPFDAPMLERCPALELVAHTGASIRPFATDELFDRGVLVTQAGAGMARSVAEVSLTFSLALLHRVPQMHNALRDPAQSWNPSGVQHEILGADIAVIGASRTGRSYLELIRALGARPLLVDPTMSAVEAAQLGTELVSLDEALARAQIVALHAPTLPETHRMIGARELALMRDGAGLVNTARSWLVDERALLSELESGRIAAAIDVFDDEPLPSDSPFRTLANVLLTPHRAAGTREGRLRQGRIIASEIESFAAGGPLLHTVSRAQLEFMA